MGGAVCKGARRGPSGGLDHWRRLGAMGTGTGQEKGAFFLCRVVACFVFVAAGVVGCVVGA